MPAPSCLSCCACPFYVLWPKPASFSLHSQPKWDVLGWESHTVTDGEDGLKCILNWKCWLIHINKLIQGDNWKFVDSSTLETAAVVSWNSQQLFGFQWWAQVLKNVQGNLLNHSCNIILIFAEIDTLCVCFLLVLRPIFICVFNSSPSCGFKSSSAWYLWF